VNGAVNSVSINGAAFPSWVVRAAVVAVAAATVVGSAPTRTTYAAAFGDAAVSVSLTQTHTIQARATGSANVSSSIESALKLAGASTATATAAGAAAVRRDVWATAGGDATCTANALVADAIGEAQATAVSTVDLAQAHIVHPGSANTLCVANAAATGDVTRYALVLLTHGLSGLSWGEASIKRNGNSYFEHDGYSLSSSTAVSSVEQDKTEIIVTLGAFDFGNSSSHADSFIAYSARVIGLAADSVQPVVATLIHNPKAVGAGTASFAAEATRVAMPFASAQADGLSYAVKARIRYVAAGGDTAKAVAVQAFGVQTVAAYANNFAGADVPVAVVFGTQHRGEINSHIATCSVQQANAVMKYSVIAQGSMAVAVTLNSVAVLIKQGRVFDALAAALVGKAFAVANSDIRAPDDRYMIVGQQNRTTIVSAQKRLMVVTA